MKSVLISINPRWCKLIASGEKTVEVRKTRPNLETPFKVYIYCTKGNDGKHFWTEQVFEGKLGKYAIPYDGNGNVIGEFVCDKIDKIFQCNSGWVQEHACISREEYFKYLGLPYNSHFDSKGAYAWYISDLVIYDKPRELSEFEIVGCQGCRDKDTYHCKFHCFGRRRLKRPPQSWCYVEDTE